MHEMHCSNTRAIVAERMQLKASASVSHEGSCARLQSMRFYNVYLPEARVECTSKPARGDQERVRLYSNAHGSDQTNTSVCRGWPCRGLTTSREHQALAAQERQRWRLSRRLARARGVDKPAAVPAQTRAAAPSFSAVLPTAADKLAPARAASLEPHRWLGCRVCSTSARKLVLQRSQRDARTTRRHPSARQPTLTARSRRARTRPLVVVSLVLWLCLATAQS